MSLIVEVNQGKLEGTENMSVLTGEPYYSFKGIPYAKPPVGDLRFLAPEPIEKWDGIYDATYERSCCINSDFFVSNGSFKGSEDCLYLNINIPKFPVDIKTLKPVMVFIHGGGFFTGSGSEKIYSSDYLIQHDVIIVTLNYRLHVMGFLNLGIPGCPGNAGLKDQVLALKWVKENIVNFGGDPENITVFGESAGASSVHFLTISPLSQGLFKKAIIQSGTVFSPWAMTNNPYEIGFEFGKKLGFKGEDKEELLDFLKRLDARVLIENVMDLQSELKKRYPCRCSNVAFSPSVETIKDGAFLPDLPENLLKTAKPLPIIFGTTNKEAILIFKVFDENFLELMKNDFSIVLKYNFKVDPALIPDLAEKVKRYYFGDEEIGLNTADAIVDLFTDIYFYKFYEAIEFVTNSSFPVYIYEFIYDGIFNMLKIMISKELNIDLKGAAHGDELGYLFYPQLLPEVPSIEGDTLKVINNLTTLWTNFAKSGNPSNELNWKPSTSAEPCYLRIDADLKLVNEKVYGKRLQFLKNLLDPVAKPCNMS